MAEYIIPGIFAVIVAVIEFIAARDRKSAKDQQAQMDERAKRREEESLLSMELMNATAMSVKVIAKKVLNEGHLNGDVKESMDSLDKARNNYERWKTEVAAKKISGI